MFTVHSFIYLLVLGRFNPASKMASISSSRLLYRLPAGAGTSGGPLLVWSIRRGRPCRSSLGAILQRSGWTSVRPCFSLIFVSILLSMQKLCRRTHAVITADLRRNCISNGRHSTPQRRTRIPTIKTRTWERTYNKSITWNKINVPNAHSMGMRFELCSKSKSVNSTVLTGVITDWVHTKALSALMKKGYGRSPAVTRMPRSELLKAEESCVVGVWLMSMSRKRRWASQAAIARSACMPLRATWYLLGFGTAFPGFFWAKWHPSRAATCPLQTCWRDRDANSASRTLSLFKSSIGKEISMFSFRLSTTM